MKAFFHIFCACLLFVFCACESPITDATTNAATTQQPDEPLTETTSTTTIKKSGHSHTALDLNLSYSANNSYNQEEVATTQTTTIPNPAQSLKTDQYAWLNTMNPADALMQRIAPPQGYQREKQADHSFAYWLQNLPLKAGKPDVYLYNGEKKGNQNAHYAVINMDVGKRDLQQCADAVMRLRAEYLLSNEQENSIQFNFTSGDAAKYSQWKKGFRPVISGNKVSWKKQKSPDNSYASFKKYMEKVFNYAGTYSLSQELKPVRSLSDIQAGDVFIQGGFPGHAVMVIEVVKNKNTGDQAFLLAQSYMPAQEMHILNNSNNSNNSPWYKVSELQGVIQTPEWTFDAADLKRF